MSSYELTQNAEEDITRIYHYGVHQFGKKQADLYFDKLFETFSEIAERPFSYQEFLVRNNSYRRAVIKSNSIFFRILSDSKVRIVAIIGNQDLSLII